MKKRQLQKHVDYIESLVSRGGPEPEEWDELNNWIISVAQMVEDNQLTNDDVEVLRRSFGESLSAITLHGISYLKPHGYAGDFEIIDRIYTNYTAPEPHTKWDLFWHDLPAARAVRNRKDYFHSILDRMSSQKESLSVLKIAIGPGRSMFEWMCGNPEYDISIDCIEYDIKAIQYASRLNEQFENKLNFRHENAMKYQHTGKKYDLIWAAGIFDYFEDDFFISLFSRLLDSKKTDGEVIVGNFTATDPKLGFLQFFDWILHYRDEEKLIELALASGAERNSISIGKEQEGVNLFLHAA
jgi:SAM-dependent methyltransferase